MKFIQIIIIMIIIEISSFLLISLLRKRFLFIITPKDEKPILDKTGLKKFFKHGYDGELGWVRKPNTEKEETNKIGKTKYSIDKNGARKNLAHENLPKLISCYGDSLTFCRQVNDNETWSWYLSKLTKTNVLNFGVGNYGIGQILLNLIRTYPKNRTKIVILSVLPATVIRMMSIWKHYHDYGNTFGFKPIFIIEDDKLKLIPNPINTKNKFYYYEKYLPQIQKHDYFYKNKFKKDMFKFPYSVSMLLKFFRFFKLRFGTPVHVELFKNKYVIKLLIKIIKKFIEFRNKEKLTVFVLPHLKEDILYIRKNGKFYKTFFDELSKRIYTIDLADVFFK